MLICPTVFLKMKQECTFVQAKCDKMVTSVMPPSLGLEKRKQ